MRILLAAALAAASLSFAAPSAYAASVNAGPNPDFVDAGAAVRFRSFGNTGGDEVFLGAPDLGVAANRVATQNRTWTDGETDFTFVIDLTNDLISATVGASPTISGAFTTDPAINAFKVTLADRDAGELFLTDLSINSLAIPDFTSIASEGFLEFFITDIATASIFTITGTINRIAPFGTSQELSRLEIAAGTAPVSAVPVPAALPLLLTGIAGLGFVARRRKAAAA